MQRDGKSVSHRLVTPERLEPRSSTLRDGNRRSRSRSRGCCSRCYSHSCDHRDSAARQCRGAAGYSVRREPSALSLIEQQMEHERERLRALQQDLLEEHDRMQGIVSSQRDDFNRNSRDTMAETQTHAKKRQSSHRRDHSPAVRTSQTDGCDHPPENSSSSTISTKDVINILNSLKHVASQPSIHKNILSEFDPCSKNQRIDIWLKKVNDCAAVYAWDERTTIYFAMQKLRGLAKVWYESLPSILYNWTQWQDKLMSAFPCKQNYGQALEDMLRRKSQFTEPIEVYFYEKLALLNQCGIEGRGAVDCIIHGLTDKTIKPSAISLHCSNPEQLLQFLMSNKESSQSIAANPLDRTH